MTIEMLYSKIHRATVTGADLNYVGSITIDEELMEAAKLRVGQKVEILNINNGERFQTYVIRGERGKGEICLNGAAARKAHPGDKIIIVAYAHYQPEELEEYAPTVVLVGEGNRIDQIITYS
ncbi:MAG: aspartate 1-decarboxylase [Nitratiruptor sp.]|nr:aspartate 1-decarboxylase [Nitratiruptor sp.]NPA83566.1 aspartate 1-decarboxylase [Campylobacterota bacterium]